MRTWRSSGHLGFAGTYTYTCHIHPQMHEQSRSSRLGARKTIEAGAIPASIRFERAADQSTRARERRPLSRSARPSADPHPRQAMPGTAQKNHVDPDLFARIAPSPSPPSRDLQQAPLHRHRAREGAGWTVCCARKPDVVRDWGECVRNFRLKSSSLDETDAGRRSASGLPARDDGAGACCRVFGSGETDSVAIRGEQVGILHDLLRGAAMARRDVDFRLKVSPPRSGRRSRARVADLLHAFEKRIEAGMLTSNCFPGPESTGPRLFRACGGCGTCRCTCRATQNVRSTATFCIGSRYLPGHRSEREVRRCGRRNPT